MRIIKGIIYSFIAVIAACVVLAVYVIGPTTIWLMDPELLFGLPVGIAKMSQPPASIAERQAAGGSLRYTEQYIPGAIGDPPVRIVIVEPKDATPGRPAILDMHGGGYMYGSPEINLTPLLEGLVLKFGLTAVSVDYRLAPGTRYPGSLHDNYAALKWLYDNAFGLGVDPRRIAIIGLSAGGGHAAALSIYARDRGEVPILFQALLYPMLDDRTGATIDPGETLGHFIWTREDNKAGWTALLGVDPGTTEVPAGAVPMRAADLSRLPPTYIAAGSLDLFATEDAAFARKLEAAGVSTQLHIFPGGFHGFQFVVPTATISLQARDMLEAYIATQFESGPAHP